MRGEKGERGEERDEGDNCEVWPDSAGRRWWADPVYRVHLMHNLATVKKRGVVSIHGPLGYEPNAPTAAPLRCYAASFLRGAREQNPRPSRQGASLPRVGPLLRIAGLIPARGGGAARVSLAPRNCRRAPACGALCALLKLDAAPTPQVEHSSVGRSSDRTERRYQAPPHRSIPRGQIAMRPRRLRAPTV